MSERLDFTTITKNIIAGRAGYQCSFPGCNRVLIGPGKNNDETICIGECAHIFSASDGGPRGKEFLTEEKIVSAENGIYLCRNHHKIIDENKGNEFSPSILLGFKAQHETMIARQLGKYPSALYWIQEITIDFPQVFKTKISVRLGKITHIYGTNNSGKTCFCKCIYDSINNKHEYISNNYSVTYKLSNQFEKEFVYSSSNEEGSKYSLNNDDYPLCPINLKIIYLAKPVTLTNDHVRDLANCFNIDIETILSILDSHYFRGLCTKRIEIVIKRKKPYLQRLIKIENKQGLLIGLDHCASSEVAKLLTDIGIILSRFFSYQSTVLYMIDWGNICILDDKNINEVLTLIESNENIFQTIIVSPDEMPKLKWSGWTFAKFVNMTPNTIIEQENF